MAFQSVPNCAEMVIRGTLQGIDVANVLGATFVGGNYGQSDIDALAGAVDTWFATEVMPQISVSATYVETVVRGLENVNDFTATRGTSSTVGGNPNTPLPNNVSYCVKFLSGLTGRSARGRFYVWGLPNNILQTNENFVTQAWRDAIVAAFVELPSYLVIAGWSHVIISRQANNAPRPTGVFFPVIGYNTTDLRLDTQRRRLD